MAYDVTNGISLQHADELVRKLRGMGYESYCRYAGRDSNHEVVITAKI